jgi:hypothetical protein
MNTTNIIDILMVAGAGYFLIDSIALMYVWCWKELHYSYHIMFFPIPLTGMLWITSDYKKIFEEFYKPNSLDF